MNVVLWSSQRPPLTSAKAFARFANKLCASIIQGDASIKPKNASAYFIVVILLCVVPSDSTNQRHTTWRSLLLSEKARTGERSCERSRLWRSVKMKFEFVLSYRLLSALYYPLEVRDVRPWPTLSPSRWRPLISALDNSSVYVRMPDLGLYRAIRANGR